MNAPTEIRIAVVSLGCPKNLVDSEKMLGLLAEAGCVVGAPMTDADVILINTCAFIAPAREESMKAIHQAVAAKKRKRRPVSRVVVAGCLPQKQAEELMKAEPGIDAIVGVFEREQIVSAVLGDVKKKTVEIRRGFCEDDRGRLRLTPRHMAYLRLGEGCSSGCSYCTIPSIRGPLRSKSPDAIVEEARELVADGTLELNLIAQDTTAYGNDLADGTDLAGLLRRLDGVEGVRWIRLMYANPATMTPAAVEAMAQCEHVVKYVDLPLQHISSRVLERMNRRYDRLAVETLLDSLRRQMNGIAIRTTFITGFPGESNEDYHELLEFVQVQRFDALGAFPYYPEEGTPASRLPNQILPKVRQRRRDKLMREQQKVAFERNESMVGRELDVLVDSTDDYGQGIGRHAGQAPEVDSVCFFRQEIDPGQIVRARVVDFQNYDLVVQTVDEQP